MAYTAVTVSAPLACFGCQKDQTEPVETEQEISENTA